MNFNEISSQKDIIIERIASSTASSEEILSSTVNLLESSEHIKEINHNIREMIHDNNEQ